MNPQRELHERCRTEQEELLEQLANESGWRKEGDLGFGNEAVSAAHEERTILELIQNARDAIIQNNPSDGSQADDGEGSVAVLVGPDALYIANTGSPFRLNTEDVFEAVTSLNRSEKADDKEAIGEKGVGMKAILQSADQFSIHSVLDGAPLSASFARSRSVSTLLNVYADLLETPEFQATLVEAYDDDVISACTSAIHDRISASSSHQDGTPPDAVLEQMLSLDKQPPSPIDVLQDIPRLSLFRYPFTTRPDSNPAGDSDARDDFVDILLTTNTSETAWESIDPALADRLAAHQNTYQTVVKLEYTDDRWQALLDDIQTALTTAPLSELSPNAARQFMAERRQISSPDESRQDSIWAECANFDLETLILLEAITDIEFLKVTHSGETGQYTLAGSHQLHIDAEEPGQIHPEASIDRSVITVESQRDDGTGEPTRNTRQFRLYSKPFERRETAVADSGWDEEINEPMRLLFESPQSPTDPPASETAPEALQAWEPTGQPLYLFYPIDAAETPFPFVIHAPFHVGFDRQTLTESTLNEQLMDELPSFIASVATDLVEPTTEAGAAAAFRRWMPWLVLPLQTETAAETSKLFEATCRRLRETSIVPTHDGDVTTPAQVLFDPERFEAFEPLRHHTTKPPLLSEDAISTGQRWVSQADAETKDGAVATRALAAQIGLTTVLDHPFDIESDETRGLISILREQWNTEHEHEPDRGNSADISGTDEWGIPIANPAHAEQYFESILAALENYEKDETDAGPLEDDDRDPVSKLGEWTIPLLPAEADDGANEDDAPELGYLVRASKRGSTSGTSGTRFQRSDRIVFRRTETSDTRASLADEIEAAPHDLNVYLTPFREEWAGTLAANYQEWGTRELAGPAAYYQRVAAEIGGFSTPDPYGLEMDADALNYLFELYYTVTAERTGQLAEWLRPTPFHNRQFSPDGEHRGVEDMLKSKYFSGSPDDGFLERRYAQCVPLLTKSGGSTCGEQLVFGAEWAEVFREAAAELETNPQSDPFTDAGDVGDETPDRATALRRWAAVIDAASDLDRSTTPTIAPPHQYKSLIKSIDVPAERTSLWLVNFLLHLGVQVGPHIEWGWLYLGDGDRDRRTSMLALGEAQALTTGGEDIPDGLPISPTRAELDRYADICWRAEHHPAFSAGHTSTCRENFLDCDPATWIDSAGNDIAIPTWWRFTELDTLDPDARPAFRRVLMLLWPELQDCLFETAWVCTDTGHYILSHNRAIPSLGLVQLRMAPLWPTDWPTGQLSDPDRWTATYNTGLNPGMQLILNPSDGDGGRRAEQEFPVLDTTALRTDLEAVADELSLESDRLIRSIATDIGAQPIDELTPSAAAEQLDWFLAAVERESDSPTSRNITPITNGRPESLKRAVYGLLSRFGSRTHLRDELPDSEPERQRRWLRRDIWHTGTRLLVNRHGALHTRQIGRDAPDAGQPIEIYGTRLPRYGRELLEDRGHVFAELPGSDAATLATILGDQPENGDETDAAVTFGLTHRSESDIPELPSSTGADIATQAQRARLDDLATEIDQRLTYLLAEYDQTPADGSLEAIYRELHEAVTATIGLVKRASEEPKHRRSAEWHEPGSDGTAQIAIYADFVSETDPTAIPSYYAADGLLQLILDHPSQRLRDAFENILMKDLAQLDREYDTADIEHRITALNDQRLRRIHRRLDALGDALPEPVAMADIDWEAVDTGHVLTILDDASIYDVDTLDLGPPPISSWLEGLRAGYTMDRSRATQCILAAAATDGLTRQERLLNVVASGVDMDLRALSTSSAWRDIDNWGGSPARQELRSYVTAVRAVETFWSELTATANPDTEKIEKAAVTAQSPGRVDALCPTGDVFPPDVVIPAHYQDVPILAFTVDEVGPPGDSVLPTLITREVQDWCANQKANVIESDVVFDDADTTSLLDTICSALNDVTTAEQQIEDAFASFGSRPASASRAEANRYRRRRTDAWLAGDDAFDTLTVETGPSPARGDSPTIGTGRGNPGDYPDAEVAHTRGRNGELLCLDRAWTHFRTLPSATREQIIEEICEWRSYTSWRMTTTSQAISRAPFLGDAGIETVADATALLAGPDGETDVQRSKAAFQALVDVSNETGPGFDYIDPFGTNYGADVSVDTWSPDWMTRVEVKSIMPETEQGRVKLTGNEFRMARRPGPDATAVNPHSDGTAYRYLVRLVSLPSGWPDDDETGQKIEIIDIDDFVQFAGFDRGDEPIWEKLRGGEFYLQFDHKVHSR